MLLVSMLLVLYCSHPLGHYLAVRSYGVSVDHFFLGRSDFRRLQVGALKVLGDAPTVGTKLNLGQLSALTPRRRGYIFGAGAILSCILVGIELIYAVFEGFHPLAIVAGSIFLGATVASEIIFGSKIGDLAKMNRQLRLGGVWTALARRHIAIPVAL
jgi:hypothetical protein